MNRPPHRLPPGRRNLLAAVVMFAAAAAGAAAVSAAAPEEKAPSPLALEQALAALEGPDWILQLEAIEQLAAWQPPEAVSALRALAKGEAPPAVRSRALVALGAFGGEAAETILALAGDEHAAVRSAAMEAIARAGVARGKPAVRRGLEDPRGAVRLAAASAAHRLEMPEAAEAVRAMAHGMRSTRHRLRAIELEAEVRGSEALPAMRRRLEDDEPRIRAAAVRAIGEHAMHGAIPALLAAAAEDPGAWAPALDTIDPEVFEAELLEAAETAEPGSAALAMVRLARRPSEAIARRLAARLGAERERFIAVLRPADLGALSRLGPEHFTDLLLGYLHGAGRPARERAAAIDALARGGGVELFPALRQTLAGGEPILKARALEHLAEAATPPQAGIVAYLEETLGDPPPADVLKTPADQQDPQTPEDEAGEPEAPAPRAIWPRALKTLARHLTGPEVGEAIAWTRPLLTGPDPAMRRAVAEALAGAADQRQRARLSELQGYITRWQLCATFPNDHQNTGLATPYPPERELALGRAYAAPPFVGFGAGIEPAEAPFGGGERRAIRLHPGFIPQGHSEQYAQDYAARLVTRFALTLPDEPGLRLAAEVSRAGGEATRGVTFSLWAGGRRLGAAEVREPRTWSDWEVDLAGLRGRRTELEIQVQPRRPGEREAAYIRQARIETGRGVVKDLVEAWPDAPRRTIPPGPREREASWRQVRAPGGTLEFFEVIAGPIGYSTAYLVTDLRVPEARRARLEIGASDAVAIFLNGQKIEPEGADGARDGGGGGGGGEPVSLALASGRNRLMVKTVNRWSDRWTLSVRLAAPDGTPLEGVSFETPTPEGAE